MNIGGTAVTSTAAEINYLDGVTSSIQTQLDAKNATISGAATTIVSSDLTGSRALTSNGSGKVAVSDVTSTELSVLDGITSTTSELNILDGVTSTTAELNILDGVTSTAAELNLMDGVTATTAEINYLDGVTSNIQTQIDNASGASNVTGLSDALVAVSYTHLTLPTIE